MKTIVRSVAAIAILALAFVVAPKPLNGSPVAYCPVYVFRYYTEGSVVSTKLCYCKDEVCTRNPGGITKERLLPRVSRGSNLGLSSIRARQLESGVLGFQAISGTAKCDLAAGEGSIIAPAERER